MGMFGSIVAAAAADEILTLLRRKMEEHRNNPEVAKVLAEIIKEVEDIKDVAASGWY